MHPTRAPRSINWPILVAKVRVSNRVFPDPRERVMLSLDEFLQDHPPVIEDGGHECGPAKSYFENKNARPAPARAQHIQRIRHTPPQRAQRRAHGPQRPQLAHITPFAPCLLLGRRHENPFTTAFELHLES